MSKHGEILDVAIVGAGVSGVYCGWRLAHAPEGASPVLDRMARANRDQRLHVGVFELSDRVGGRLLSVTPPGMPKTRCELGGMRYTTNQVLVRSLVEKKLQLPYYNFPVSNPNNLAYLRGRHLRTGELTDPAKVPFDLDPMERGRDPGGLFAYAIDQLIPDLARANGIDQMREVLKTARVRGVGVADMGFWNLMALGLSHEAYRFALQASGYDTIGLNWNAVDTILLNIGDFGAKIEYRGLVDGYDSLPRTLADQFRAQGGAIHFNHRLESLEPHTLPDGTEVVRLTFPRGHCVDARHVILAMPRRSLEPLVRTGPVLAPENGTLQERIWKLITSVTPIPLFKMFVAYPYPWWQILGLKQGQSVTDLPVRQCYYWAVESSHWGADPDNHNSVLLATYDDTLNVNFWQGYVETDEERWRSYRDRNADPMFLTRLDQNPFARDEDAARCGDVELNERINQWEKYKAPRAMVDEIQRQLQEMHGLRFVPEPYAAAFKDWSDAPFGGGVNFWNIHARSWEIIPQMIRPNPSAPVYVCGEAYSNGQGWVEGALETAEMVLDKYFGLPRPDWLIDTEGGADIRDSRPAQAVIREQ